ncbi:MAG: capsular polysaccharide synthesis protein [Proteobacteria bacterium]|nr:capsular polysaccharide synthesis protein [Pseudomonadota bacterium]MBU1060667.1 capsular polysaccharide synthesis protein [Pseudomonadota bacterium]
MERSKQTTLWLYWKNLPGSQMPVYLKMCYEVMVKNCPECDVVLVTPEILCNFLPNIPFDLDAIRLHSDSVPPIALAADYIRVALLEKYGGIWMDIDCLVLTDLGPLVTDILSEYDFYSMHKTETNNVVSNGFMASRPHGIVISQYLQVMTDLIQNKLACGESFSWSEIGASMLTPIAFEHKDVCYFEPEKIIHPIHFEDSDIFWKRTDRLDLDELIPANVKVVMLYNKRFTASNKITTRRQLLNSNCLLGALMRRELPEQALWVTSPQAPEHVFTPQDVELVFTTIARPKSCIKFIKSVRQQLGNDVAIHFVAQGDAEPEYEQAEVEYGCKVTRVGNDYGLGASRNLLVAAAERPLVFLCDDDFIFDDRLHFKQAIELMSLRQDIGVLGGLFENYTYDDSDKLISPAVVTCFNHLTWREGEVQKYLPAEYIDIPRQFITPCFYIQQMDTVNNFTLFRREIFADYGLRWEPQCKITGEHEKFYADYHTIIGEKLKVCYTNLLVTQHHRRSNQRFAQLRDRDIGLVAAMQSMHIRQMHFYGKRNEFLQQDKSMHRSGKLFWRQP